jgi:O-antigen/teichoic acid export membrane protein
MSKLKNKTITGVLWSAFDNGINQIIQFVVGIILARILSPKEFGLIGMLTIFIVLSEIFINSGFSQALIRKKDCGEKDYNTAFIFNLFTSLIFYFLLFICAPWISDFYHQPELTQIIRIIGIILFINAFSIVQEAILIKKVNFKLQAKITLISSVFSGAISIWIAVSGFGVWSLVAKTLLGGFFRTSLLWVYNKWLPSGWISKDSFRKMFYFGYKLLASSVINTTYQNLYYLVIGKFFSVIDLGYFTRADHFTKLPSQTLTKSLQRVAFPVLSEIQEDLPRLKNGYQKFIRVTMFFNANIMLTLAALATPFVLGLLGEKWAVSIPYLQLLCFATLLMPINSLNMNLLVVKGKSGIYLWIEIVTKILAIPIIIVGIYTSIKIIVYGMIIHSIITFIIICLKTSKLIDYSILNQIRDVLPGFLIAFSSSGVIYIIQYYLNINPLLELIALGLASVGLIIASAEIVREKGYIEVKKILLDRIKLSKIKLTNSHSV